MLKYQLNLPEITQQRQKKKDCLPFYIDTVWILVKQLTLLTKPLMPRQSNSVTCLVLQRDGLQEE